MKCNVIWLDENLDSEEKKKYTEVLKSFGSLIVRLFKNLDKAIEHMKYIEFQETKLIVSGKLYPEFVNKFKENIIDMCVAPKIIIFTRNKQKFIENNKYLQNNTFYNFGGVADTFQEVVKFLKNENKLKKLNNSDDVRLTFEYIDKKEKLFLPLFFKTLIDNISNNNMEKYTSSLYDDYSKNNEDVKNLLGSIKSISDIPMEILSKYYARLYTAESDFYKNINKDLRLNKVEKYLSYIKTLYEGVKLKSLPLANNNILYRGSKISNDEIKKIKNYINNKIKDLPSSIVFSKLFLSFTKDKNIADYFLSFENNNKNLSKVLFVLEKDDNIGYNLSTHCDIEKISFIPNEREVLFLPFSSFEIKDIKEIKIGNEKGYEIKLSYLGKYLKDIENDKNIIIEENKIPDTEFKKQICEVGLIKKEKVENINTKILYNNFKQYEIDMNNNNENKLKSNNNINNNQNIIFGEIYIDPFYINKNVSIINSFENWKREMKLKDEEDDWKNENEKEIKENIEIKINEKIIPFSYFHKFEKEGKYNIQYLLKNNLIKINHLFSGCNLLTNLNLSNFNTKNVTNMSSMFRGCNSLINLNLSNLNTQNVTNMNNMFCGCISLTNLNLSNFNTQNVNDMSNMFYCCESLINLNLSNFNTQNVTNMNSMFYYCTSLTNLNLSKFNTQNVTDMYEMFINCKSLTNLNLSNFNTKNVTNMRWMFYDCNSLRNLNLSNFNTQNINDMCFMFCNCNSLNRNNIITKDNRIIKEFDNNNNK